MFNTVIKTTCYSIITPESLDALVSRLFKASKIYFSVPFGEMLPAAKVDHRSHTLHETETGMAVKLVGLKEVQNVVYLNNEMKVVAASKDSFTTPQLDDLDLDYGFETVQLDMCEDVGFTLMTLIPFLKAPVPVYLDTDFTVIGVTQKAALFARALGKERLHFLVKSGDLKLDKYMVAIMRHLIDLYPLKAEYIDERWMLQKYAVKDLERVDQIVNE